MSLSSGHGTGGLILSSLGGVHLLLGFALSSVELIPNNLFFAVSLTLFSLHHARICSLVQVREQSRGWDDLHEWYVNGNRHTGQRNAHLVELFRIQDWSSAANRGSTESGVFPLSRRCPAIAIAISSHPGLHFISILSDSPL